jgi:transcriptional regulator with XRE-family HTH domain
VDLRVREWRKHRDLSYRQLAERAGIALSTLYRIESGAASPTVAMLERLAAALDIRVVDFFPVEPKRRASR